MKNPILWSVGILVTFFFLPAVSLAYNTPLSRFADCWEAGLRCTRTLETCKDRLYGDGVKCGTSYTKAELRCSTYEAKADALMPKCQQTFTTCSQRAQTASNPERSLVSCQEKLAKCQQTAFNRIGSYRLSAEKCYIKAQNNKFKCDQRYFATFPRKLATCERNLISCAIRVERKCN